MRDDIIEIIDEREQDGFTIKAYALPECISPREVFVGKNEGANAQIIEDIDTGRLLWFGVKVAAHKAGIELATEYLGGCCYTSFAEFASDEGGYSDMRTAVVEAAKDSILNNLTF